MTETPEREMGIDEWLSQPREEQTLPWRPFTPEEFRGINFDAERFDEGCDRDTLIRLTYTIRDLLRASSLGEPVSQEAPGDFEPFVVRFYTDDPGPTIKGNGFDGLRIGEEREGAEEFVAWVNARIASRSARTENGPETCPRCSRPVIVDLAAWMYDSDAELDEMCQCPPVISSASPLSDEEREAVWQLRVLIGTFADPRIKSIELHRPDATRLQRLLDYAVRLSASAPSPEDKGSDNAKG